ncbi:universal stress protein [Crenobacter cavernae]|nr:universal stress protein [Crenobacter cavernae]
MAYKSLLVHVDSSPRAAARLDTAIVLAQTFDAHLTGLFVAPLPLSDGGFAAAPYPHTSGTTPDYVEASARRAQDTFENAVRLAGLASVEWRQLIGAPIEDMYLNARYHDLVIIGQGDPTQSIDKLPTDYPQTVLMGAGRPVLIVPYSGSFDTVGQQILVGWDARQEATRALTNALPLLKRAKRTQVLTINPVHGGDHGEVPGMDIAIYLARHGVEVEVMSEHGASVDVGNLLLSNAADMGADLIVMGAYGHSRLREIMLGGATQTVLESMTVPVLMSH